MIDSAIRTYLLTITGLTALIVDRIYPATSEPQEADYPYIIYSEINGIPGDINEKESEFKYYQFTIYSQSYDQCQTIKQLLKTAFNMKPNGNYTDVDIAYGLKTGSRDHTWEPQTGTYSASVDIKVSYAII